MHPIEIYAVVLAGMLAAVLCLQLVTSGRRLLRQCKRWSLSTTLSQTVLQTRWVPALTWASVLTQSLLVGSSLLLVFYGTGDTKSAARNAGSVAILNMALFFLGPHLSYQADVLGLTLSTTKSVHRSMTVPLVLTASFHSIVLRPSQPVFRTPFSSPLYGVVASLAMALLFILSIPPARRWSYELFLRAHQLLAGIILYAVWAHCFRSGDGVARYDLIVMTGLLGIATIGQLVHILVVNRGFRSGLPRARVTMLSGIFRVRVDVPMVLRLHPGQYINLCIPGLTFRSMFQSHPFMVASAQRCGNTTTLELVVEPRRGWTSKLYLARTRNDADDRPREATRSYLCVFSGPHGHGVRVDNYGTVLLIASGWGILALLPYLQHLVQGHTSCTVKARHVHLVWQLHDANDGRPIADLLDGVLAQDKSESAHVRVPATPDVE